MASRRKRLLAKKIKEAKVPPAWREFELLIARIEDALGPTGAAIKSPDKLLDLQTGTMRDVDVSVRFRAGTADVLITVEGRDRSRAGDIGWIEQLIEKKRSCGISNTIAVSRKGFSKTARRKAALGGIELRILKEITAAVIGGWLTVGDMTVPHEETRLDGVLFNIADRRPGEKPPAGLNARDPVVVELSTGRRKSLVGLFVEHKKKHMATWSDVAYNGVPVHRTFDVALKPGLFAMELDGNLRPLLSLTFQVAVIRTTQQVPLAHFEYGDGDEAAVRGAEAKFEAGGVRTIASIVRDEATGRIRVRAEMERGARVVNVDPPEVTLVSSDGTTGKVVWVRQDK